MKDILTYLVSLFHFDSTHPLLFTQIHFWVFLLLVYVVFCFFTTGRTLSKGKRIARNAYLFFVSLIFYYKTSGLFVLLLIFSTILGYLLGCKMDAATSQSRRKNYMIVGVVVNLLMLCYFKYAYFFTDIYNASFNTNLQVVDYLAKWSNAAFHTTRFDTSVIILPVGISFYTFQNISYIVDIYKRKIAHVDNILDFGFYTTFFPQLVAGPILRADQFVPQLYKPFFLSRRHFGIATFWIANGLIKKIVLSDYLAVNFIDRVFDFPSLYTPFENFAALVVYSLQVYADFSGYTDIAIGVSLLMGFHLPKNFNSPYKSTNPSEFWRRWHISLGRWLRDYLYIPLGGNRRAGLTSYCILFVILAISAFMLKNSIFTIVVIAIAVIIILLYLLYPKNRKNLGTDINNMDTMLLGGLWHGASFNFITWGGLNGLGILIFKLWKRNGWIENIILLTIITIILHILRVHIDSPLLNIIWFVSLVYLIGYTILNFLPQQKRTTKRSTTVWSVVLTFVFISFTRLFFRSGSNLNPAEANEIAWQTASLMVEQIGSQWNLAQIPQIISSYSGVFILFAIGMVIHWLPEHFKRRYRLWFATMPLAVMIVFFVVLAFLLYQFITADLQPFIYFQF